MVCSILLDICGFAAIPSRGWEVVIERSLFLHSKPARAGLFPTPCANPKGSLLVIALRSGKAVAIQTGSQNTTPKER